MVAGPSSLTCPGVQGRRMIGLFVTYCMGSSIALAAIVTGIATIATADIGWRYSRRLTSSAQTGRPNPAQARPTCARRLSTVLGGLVQIVFGLVGTAYLIQALFRHLH